MEFTIIMLTVIYLVNGKIRHDEEIQSKNKEIEQLKTQIKKLKLQIKKLKEKNNTNN